MAYVKTNWVDNTTPIDENNLNKIEQGIYDNSLVVDAVTNTLNPTDTETYKTAELTEGQITDVIGVNDIIIKGQTEQDGTPTPSSPVDVNVVSGSNVINISNKNLAQHKSGYINVSTGVFYSSDDDCFYFPVVKGETYYCTSTGNRAIGAIYNNVPVNRQACIAGTNINNISKNGSFVANATGIMVIYANTPTSQSVIDTFMITRSSTATTYEPHQGKELPLDLPVENLFDKTTITEGKYIDDSGNYVNQGESFVGNYIEIDINENYTISSENTTAKRIIYYTENKTFISREVLTSIMSKKITIPNNTKYVRLSCYNIDLNSLQFEKNSRANAYTPYGTTPIELCKIGNYQDYFYKSGSKWYLHKGVNKITSYNGETITTSYISTTGELSTGAKVYYALATATNTEITNTTLISQLEAIYNAPLYEQANITQTNNDLPMILDITACKDNINGIKAFIRK